MQKTEVRIQNLKLRTQTPNRALDRRTPSTASFHDFRYFFRDRCGTNIHQDADFAGF
jgi:hypothetical protein